MVDTLSNIPDGDISQDTTLLDVKKRLGIPETDDNPELFHQRVVTAIVNRDLIETAKNIWKDMDANHPNLDRLPLVLAQPVGRAIEQAGGFEAFEALYPAFTPQEQIIIAKQNAENADVFESQGEKIKAIEARRIAEIFIDTKLRTIQEPWARGQQLNGVDVSELRRRYTKGLMSDLNGYLEYQDTVAREDDAKGSALKIIEVFNSLKSLGIGSYKEALGRLGMDAESVRQKAQTAVSEFESIRGDLDQRIQELVDQGLIPDNERVRKSYAAYIMAATSLDSEKSTSSGLTPQEMFDQFAKEEGVEVPEGSVLILTNAATSGGQPRASMMAFIEGDKSYVGVTIRLPGMVADRATKHESAHGLATLIIGHEYGSPLLAVQSSVPNNEMAGTYGGYKSEGGDSYFSGVEGLRFPILNEAQFQRLDELDLACSEGNVDKVAAILKSPLTSENISSTFGNAVLGEGRGLYPGIFGISVSANPDAIKMIKQGANLKDIVQSFMA